MNNIESLKSMQWPLNQQVGINRSLQKFTDIWNRSIETEEIKTTVLGDGPIGKWMDEKK